MSAAHDTIMDLNAAIRQSGSYDLQDKGASEVMDVHKIELRLSHAGIGWTNLR